MKILVLVEKTLPLEIWPALDAYLCQLRAEGYDLTLRFTRQDPKQTGEHIRIAQEITWPFCREHGPDCYILLVGRVPVARSGLRNNPDGHSDTAGAYACPMYYACPSEKWTDLGDNTGFKSRRGQLNAPGDFRFDQETLTEVGPLLARVGVLNLNRLKPGTFKSALDTTDFTIAAYRNYFERNLAYRRGEWRPRTLVGTTTYDGRELGGIRDWAARAIPAEQYGFTRSITTVEERAPYAVAVDFKLLEKIWSTRANVPFCVLYLTYGSYQIDEDCSQMNLPLWNGALAIGNMGLNYEIANVLGGTTGDAWFKAANRAQRGAIMALYGDPTLKLPR